MQLWCAAIQKCVSIRYFQSSPNASRRCRRRRHWEPGAQPLANLRPMILIDLPPRIITSLSRLSFKGPPRRLLDLLSEIERSERHHMTKAPAPLASLLLIFHKSRANCFKLPSGVAPSYSILLALCEFVCFCFIVFHPNLTSKRRGLPLISSQHPTHSAVIMETRETRRGARLCLWHAN